jgi:hypothetical protein
MKKEKLNQKLVKIANGQPKISKSSIGYKCVADVINGTNNSGCVFENQIRPVYTRGSGKWTNIADHSKLVTSLLDALKIKYIAGNDAPMGGRCGYFITIISKFED